MSSCGHLLLNVVLVLMTTTARSEFTTFDTRNENQSFKPWERVLPPASYDNPINIRGLVHEQETLGWK